MVKYFVGLVLGLVMLVGTESNAAAQSCEGGACRVGRAAVAAPFQLVRRVQPVKRVVALPGRVVKWVQSDRPVRSLLGRVVGRRGGCGSGCGCG